MNRNLSFVKRCVSTVFSYLSANQRIFVQIRVMRNGGETLSRLAKLITSCNLQFPQILLDSRFPSSNAAINLTQPPPLQFIHKSPKYRRSLTLNLFVPTLITTVMYINSFSATHLTSALSCETSTTAPSNATKARISA